MRVLRGRGSKLCGSNWYLTYGPAALSVLTYLLIDGEEGKGGGEAYGTQRPW
jgi:hypothetical protein